MFQALFSSEFCVLCILAYLLCTLCQAGEGAPRTVDYESLKKQQFCENPHKLYDRLCTGDDNAAIVENPLMRLHTTNFPAQSFMVSEVCLKTRPQYVLCL